MASLLKMEIYKFVDGRSILFLLDDNSLLSIYDIFFVILYRAR